MSTCLDIITYAMRQGRILRLGAVPKAAEAVEGLAALQSLYDGWVTGGMFGTLEDVTLDANDTAEEGKRYFIPTAYALTAATSSYDDGSGRTRQPHDLSVYETLTEAGVRSVKIYDRTAWVDLLDLEQSDVAPLSSRGKYGLSACLAIDGGLVSAFGAKPAREVYLLAGQFKRGIMGKKGTTQADKSGVYY